MSDAGQRHRPARAGSQAGAEAAEGDVFLPPSTEGGPLSGDRMEGVRSERERAAARISHTLKVWRKASGDAPKEAEEEKTVSDPGDAAEKEADEVADNVAAKLHGGEQEKSEAKAGDHDKAGAEHEEEAKAGKEQAPQIGAKLDGHISRDAKDKKKPQENRGRLQVQGKDMKEELSWPWNSDKPPTADDALAALAGLRAKCNKSELALRDQAFKDAEAFIQRCKGKGVDAQVSQTFQNPNLPKKNKDARVDIEVSKGKAFV